MEVLHIQTKMGGRIWAKAVKRCSAFTLQMPETTPNKLPSKSPYLVVMPLTVKSKIIPRSGWVDCMEPHCLSLQRQQSLSRGPYTTARAPLQLRPAPKQHPHSCFLITSIFYPEYAHNRDNIFPSLSIPSPLPEFSPAWQYCTIPSALLLPLPGLNTARDLSTQ